MSRANLESGRINQKLRTRNALMEAAAQLIADGRALNLPEVATLAGVSRATAYRYFPNPDAMLLETQLHMLVKKPEELFPTSEGDPGERARRVLEHLQGLTADHEPAFRQLLRGTMDRWLETKGAMKLPLRGGRRLALLTEALAPLRATVGPLRHDRLVEALAMLVSLETYFAGRDVCQISAARIGEVLGWVVEVLVAASVSEAAND